AGCFVVDVEFLVSRYSRGEGEEEKSGGGFRRRMRRESEGEGCRGGGSSVGQ
ncbi:hypothetical protein HAX54_044663, partial [Datura stramonium]|nr:hypothetical protein [Datura stramonium]